MVVLDRRLRAALTAVALACAAACARTAGPPLPGPTASPVVFPAPPDTPRIQFLAAISGSADLGPARRSLLQRAAGTGPRDQAVLKPYGIAATGSRLYVCDTRLGGVHVIDLDRGRIDPIVPEGPGRLRNPINCAVDADLERLYVADPGRGDVVVFDLAGRFLHAIPVGANARPTDVEVTGDTLWVVDVERASVTALGATEGNRIGEWPAGCADTLYAPTNLTVRDSLLYVTDTGGFDVKVFHRDGRLLRTVGGLGRTAGRFMRPKGLAVDREHRMYVVDAAFENVQIFDDRGRLLLAFGGPYQGPGDLWLPADIALHYHDLERFRPAIIQGYRAEYLILVTSQFGPAKISLYAFLRPE